MEKEDPGAKAMKLAERLEDCLEADDGLLKLQLVEQLSTDTAGIAKCLGLQSESRIELEMIIHQIESKLSEHTLMSIETPPPAGTLLDQAAEHK